MLRAAEDALVIERVDQVFSMAMHYPSLGDYVTDNRVVDPAVLQPVSFPRVSPEQLQDSVYRLIALAST